MLHFSIIAINTKTWLKYKDFHDRILFLYVHLVKNYVLAAYLSIQTSKTLSQEREKKTGIECLQPYPSMCDIL